MENELEKQEAVEEENAPRTSAEQRRHAYLLRLAARQRVLEKATRKAKLVAKMKRRKVNKMARKQ